MGEARTDWTADAWQDCPPIAGHYRMRRPGPEHWSKREWQAVLIWFSEPADPVTGLKLDRSPRWQALRDGEPVEINEVWPWCGRKSITEAEYDAMMEARDG